MNRIWDPLIAKGRLRGVVQDGTWFHVGMPDAITATESILARMSGAKPGVVSGA